MKPLPDFVVIGGLRTGTTTLHTLLSQVPSICLTKFKEPDFALTDETFARGIEWYRDLFEFPERVCGEVSPNYSSVDVFPRVADRLKKISPDTKIIYIVRKPIDRVRSHYAQTWLKGLPLPQPEKLDSSPAGLHILNGSRYFYQISPFVDAFGNKNILILDFEQLTNDPASAVRKLCAFVGAELSETDAANIRPVQANSSDALGSLPNWWRRASRYVKTSKSPVLRGIYKLLPKTMIEAIKGLVRKSTSDRTPPTFTDRAIELVRDELAKDAQAFRMFSGKRFEDWSV